MKTFTYRRLMQGIIKRDIVIIEFLKLELDNFETEAFENIIEYAFAYGMLEYIDTELNSIMLENRSEVYL